MSLYFKLQPCSLYGHGRVFRSASFPRSFSTSRSLKISQAITAVPAPPKQKQSFKLPAALLSYHWDTLPPTNEQLVHADKFFSRQPPAFLWSAEKFKTMSFGDAFGDSPEVCFLGRSNVGKSSLLNALLGRRIAYTSSKPGRTKLMNAFAVGGAENNGKNRLVVLDMPGYGKGGRAEWGTEVLKYLEKRRQLSRAFLLVDSEHGIKTNDKQLLALFRERGIPFQVILSKVDRVLFDGSRRLGENAAQYRMSNLRRTMESVQQAVQPDTEEEGGGLGEVLACSSEKWVDGERMGINAVRFAMLRAAGMELQAKPKAVKPVEIVSFDDIYGKTGPSG